MMQKESRKRKEKAAKTDTYFLVGRVFVDEGTEMVEIAVPEETTPVFIEAKLLNMGGDCRVGIIAPEELDFVVDVFRIAIIGRDTLRCNAAAAR